MFESYSNLIFIAVLMAISLARFIVRARKKPSPPPPRAPSAQFQKKEEAVVIEQGHWVRKDADQIKVKAAAPAARPAVKARQTKAPFTPSLVSAALAPEGSIGSLSAGAAPASGKNPRGGALSVEQTGVSFNLNHLSPMKQAVVMAEILGPPKGMI